MVCISNGHFSIKEFIAFFKFSKISVIWRRLRSVQKSSYWLFQQQQNKQPRIPGLEEARPSWTWGQMTMTSGMAVANFWVVCIWNLNLSSFLNLLVMSIKMSYVNGLLLLCVRVLCKLRKRMQFLSLRNERLLKQTSSVEAGAQHQRGQWECKRCRNSQKSHRRSYNIYRIQSGTCLPRNLRGWSHN